MAKKKAQKRSFYDHTRPLHRIIAGVLIAVAVLLGFFVVSDLFSTNNSPLGRFTMNVLKGLFASGTYIIPILLMWHGITWVQDVERKRVISRGIYHLLFLILYGALWFSFSSERSYLGYSPADLYRHGVELSGGGFLGGSLGFVLYHLTGFVGVPFLTVVLILLYCYHILGITPHSLWEKHKAKQGAETEDKPREAPRRDPVDDGLFPEDESFTCEGVEEKPKRTPKSEQSEETPKMTWREKRRQKRAQKQGAKKSPTDDTTSLGDDYYPETHEQSFEELFRQIGREAQAIQREGGRRQATTSVTPSALIEDDEYFSSDEVETPLADVSGGVEDVSSTQPYEALTADQAFGAFNPLSQSAIINTAPTLLRPEADSIGLQAEPIYSTPSDTPLAEEKPKYEAVPGGIRGMGEGMGSYIIRTQHMNIPSTRNPTPTEEPVTPAVESIVPSAEDPIADDTTSVEDFGGVESTADEVFDTHVVETTVPSGPIVATDHVAKHPLREQVIVETRPTSPAPQPRATTTPAAPPAPKPKTYEHIFPPLSLLTRSVPITNANSQAEIDETSARLVSEFRKFKHEITVREVTVGPRVTRYAISPPDGVRMSTIIGLANDIALGLAVKSIRIDPVPNTPYLGVEIPTRTPQTVRLSSLIDTPEFRSTKTITTVPLGANITGAPVFADIAKMPHVLIAGATGMGKSVLMNSILLSLLYKARPDEVKMILIDPKRVEMSMYNGIPHLLIPPVVEPQKAAGALIWATGEMERRYHLMENAGTRSIEGYNDAVKSGRVQGEPQPKIIIVIDELNDLMMQARDAVEPAITSIAQKARAAGIHLIIGTQRPSVDVITGLIKANIPSRIALHVSSGTDSRTILDAYGAEKLLDKGDMLAVISGAEAIRVQSAFVSDEEVENVTSFLRQNAGGNVYDEIVSSQIDSETERYRNSGKRAQDRDDDGEEADGSYFEDSNFMKACRVALTHSKISTSLLQRTCGIGYGKAAKYIDQMEIIGLVSEPNGQKPRDVLMSEDQFMEMVSRESYSGD